MTLTPFAFDWESDPITDWDPVPEPVCMSWACGSASAVVLPDDGVRILRTVLSDPRFELVGAWTAIDVLFSTRREPSLWPLWLAAYRSDRVTDVQLRQPLIDFSFGVQRQHYNLGVLAKIHETPTQPDKSSKWRTAYGSLRGVPLADWPREAIDYSLSDAVGTLEIHQAQERQRSASPYFHGRDALRSQYHEARGAFGLLDLANTGLTASPKRAAAFRAQLEAVRDRLLPRLYELGLYVDEYTKDQAAMKARAPELVSAGGRFTTSRKRLLAHSDPAIQALAFWPHSQKFLVAAGLALHRFKSNRDAGLARMAAAPVPQTALDSDSCNACGDPVMADFAELSAALHKLNNYVPLIEHAAKSPRHTFYRPLQSTGRTSSGQNDDGDQKGNDQNMTRASGVCECYVPPDGWLVLDADYPAIELRTFAQIALWWCGFSQLAVDLNAGVDPHLRLAAELLNVDYPTAERMKDANDPKIKPNRTAAKGVNFGRKGKMAAPTFVGYVYSNYGVRLGVNMSPQLTDKLWQRFCWRQKIDPRQPAPEHLRDAWEKYAPIGHAQHLIDLHDKLTPEFPIYSSKVQSFKRLSAELFDLVHPVTERLRAGLFFTSVHNYPFQGLAIDIAKAALWEVSCEIRDPASALFGCRGLLFEHDAIKLIAPRERAQAAARRQSEVMGGVAERWLPNIKCRVEVNIMTCLSKHGSASDPRYDASGNVIIWDPVEQMRATVAKLPAGADARAALVKDKWASYLIDEALCNT